MIHLRHRSAVMYGANASGKTNILKSLNFIVRFIRTSHRRQKGDSTGVIPFKMAEEYLNRPSIFEITFVYGDVKYTYGFSANKNVIFTEFLYYYPNKKKEIIFERKDTNNFLFGTDHEEQKTLSSRTLENVLYLSSATQWNFKKTAQAFEWFINKIEIIIEHENHSLRRFTVEKINEESKYYDIVIQILARADIGLTDVVSTVTEVKRDNLPSDMDEDVKEFLVKSKAKQVTITTFHEVFEDDNKKVVEFDLDEESGGIQKLFDLLGVFIDVLENGKTLIVDELDFHLHPLLVRSLIELFHTSDTNPRNAQLFFSTHNSNLLNLNIFRRDQIWFAEKQHETGATDIFSLGDFSYIENENIEKGYLAGKYGAIPFLRDFGVIFSRREDNESSNPIRCHQKCEKIK